ncbi:MAG TPA: hypothetical protein VF242_04495 [Nitrososphaeraceae archaeon]
MLKNEDRIPNRFKKNAFNEKEEILLKFMSKVEHYIPLYIFEFDENIDDLTV